MKALYQAIRTRIESECPSIKWVRLFNNQFVRSNDDNPSKNVEEAFPYPCVFIEFPGDNEPDSSGYGAKRLNVFVRLHIGFESYAFEDLVMFDIAAEVQQAVENWNTTGLTPLVYLAQRMDYDHDNVYIYTLEFRTQFSDETAYVKRNEISAPDDTALDLNVDLDIDNDIIRTGNGVIE